MNNASDRHKDLAAEFLRLVEVLKRLRAPDGCPWDREQTPPSIKKYILEEAHELFDAIDAGDTGGISEELGDLFFLPIFLADIYEEQGDFDLSETLLNIKEKMIRRHPHIFGDAKVENSREVIVNWQAIKGKEALQKGKRKSVLGNLPRSLPALQRAFRLGERASRIGFDWESAEGVFEKIDEEILELKAAVHQGDSAKIEEEIGDFLFSAANLSRKLGINPEEALKKALDKFVMRFHAMEDYTTSQHRDITRLSPEELDRAWEKVK